MVKSDWQIADMFAKISSKMEERWLELFTWMGHFGMEWPDQKKRMLKDANKMLARIGYKATDVWQYNDEYAWRLIRHIR